ncbi:MAG: alpha-ribazole phosphatase family protein [Thiotrichales bacterium]|jgi:alpha-ribazole phosphatase/probable phosphoglycerate mutase|nr:alpha-ribazole phosphatase family protein [Thiotrichales bacterium]MBT3752443.1 alpha-ribazole phosphatase family protein [Thiotrichales bacterium]MBT3836969.1 alpha-ribazole phosphatase family protein [Thiotrichales bacterium]MBT4152726.1 alpha-ribazole phosphatase family protein [Thiotrichales bacterium]MBT4261866.1 alpha-ribazole phosphatase family protein [Thiotrichales bacterium]
MSSTTTIVDLMRHGEPVGGSCYRGKIDDPLSKKGWKQMRSAVGNYTQWDIVITSTLSRCAEFATEVAERVQIPVIKSNNFMEIGFGEWEGKTAAEIMQKDEQLLYRFWSDPLHNTPPQAEQLTKFRERVVGEWDSIISKHQGKKILLVAHAGVLRMLISQVLAMPIDKMFRIKVPNAGVSRISIEHFGVDETLPQLIFHAGKLE